MLVRRDLEQLGPQRRFGRQIEPVPGSPGQPGRQLRLRHPAHRKRHRATVQHPLERHPVDLGDHGPQALVPPQHIGECGLQGPTVELPAQAERQRDVVRRTGALQLVQEPEPALGERQRHRVTTVVRDQRGPGLPRVRQPGREAGHRRRLEQRPQLQLHAEHRTHARHQPGRQQRMPAQLEEAVVHAHFGYAEHLAEQLGEQLLLRRPRHPARPGRGELGLGQGCPVQLADRRQRQGVQRDERGRHQVVRQPLTQELPQLLRPGSTHHVRDQPVRPREHHRPYDTRVFGEHRLDLTRLHTETAHLHLLVGPPGELQLTTGRPAHQVTRAVHPGAGRPVRVGDEPLRRQRRTAQVTTRHTRTGEVELARDTGRERLEARIKHVCTGVEDRAADQRSLGGVDPGDHGVDRALGRTVEVEALDAVRRPEVLPEPLRDGLAARDDDRRPPVGAGEQAVPDQYLEVGGRRLDEVDAVGGQPAECLLRVGPGLAVGDVQLVAVEQAGELVPGGVEGDRGGERDPQPAPSGTLRREDRTPVRGEQVHHTRVGDDDALGTAGRAGGVDHVRGVLRAQRHLGRGVRAACEQAGRLRGVEDQAVCRRQGVGQPAPGHRQDGPGVGEHLFDPGGRVVRVGREVGGAGLQHRQDRHHQLGRARQCQRHQLLGAGAVGDQGVGETVGPRVELGVGQGGVAGHHGHGVGSGHRLGLEQRGQGRVGDLGRRVVADGQQLVSLVGRQQPDPADLLVRVGGGEGVEQPEQALLVLVQLVGAVRLRCGLEAQLGAGAVPPVPDGEREVGGQRGGEVVRSGAVPGEVEAVVERHDVDDQRERRAQPAGQAEVALEVLAAVAVVRADRADLGGRLRDQLGQRHLRPDGQPQRRHVGDHAGDGAQDLVGAAADGQAEHDVPRAGQPVDVQRGGGDQHARPAHARAVGGRAQGGRVGGGEQGGPADDPVGVARRAGGGAARRAGGGVAGQAARFGPVGEAAGPVRAVGRELLGLAVAGVARDQVGERTEGGRPGRLARHQGGVGVREAARDQGVAEAVHHDVVVGLVPEELAFAQLEQRVAEQRVAGDVHRAGHVRRDPALRRRARVGRGADVDPRQLPVHGGAQDLLRTVGPGREADVQGVRLADHQAQRGLEPGRVEGPVDLQVLADAVGGVRGARLLFDEPDFALSGGKRQH